MPPTKKSKKTAVTPHHPASPGASPQVGKRPFPTISSEEYSIRRQAVAAGIDAAGLDAICVFYPARVAYLTGFHHIPTERPIALVLGPKGFSALLVPAVEKEHAETTGLERVDVYFEYPGSEHPMERLAAILAEIGARLGLSESAVKSGLFRMRQRYGELFREEIGHTVASPAEVDSELRELFAALA